VAPEAAIPRPRRCATPTRPMTKTTVTSEAVNEARNPASPHDSALRASVRSTRQLQVNQDRLIRLGLGSRDRIGRGIRPGAARLVLRGSRLAGGPRRELGVKPLEARR
jgi:hypothetical protein